MLFIEFYCKFSDVEVAQQVKYNILYRFFCGLQIHDSTPDDTSLVVFRERLGKDRFDRLFDRIVLQAEEKNLLTVSWDRKKKDKLASFVDSDARFGKTSPDIEDNFCGYKVHIAEMESSYTSINDIFSNERKKDCKAT